MRTNVYKLLFYGLLMLVLGYFVGRFIGRQFKNDQHGHMECCDKDGNCEHGGTCCKPDGHCNKAGCDHAAMMEGHGKACCKGHKRHGDGHGHAKTDDAYDQIVKDLEAADFQGDTTIGIPNGTLQVNRSADRMEVRVYVEENDVSVEEEVAH